MFAPPIAKAEGAAKPGRGLAVQSAARGFGGGGAEPAVTRPRSIGNQAALRRLSQQGAGPAGPQADGEHGQEAWESSQDQFVPADGISPFGVSPLPYLLQPKLAIGAMNDPLEHEADRVADRVMRMADPGTVIAAAPAQISRKCATCDKDDVNLQKKPAAQPAAAGTAPAIVHQALHVPGQPLSTETRAFMEPRFGQNLDFVRIHTGPLAADSAAAVGALAYTVGRDIVFNAGNYAPATAAGGRLLAHELTHVLQQNAPGNPAAAPRLSRAPDPQHCSGWTCSAIPCKQPDKAGDGSASTSWRLDVNIDTDVEKSTDINLPADVGHASVDFQESNGTEYSFGFYPLPDRPPDEMISMVPGCTAHPDTTHKPCFDYTEHYTLTQEQYNDALGYAQAYCAAPPKYALFDNNCTTFVVNVAKKASQNPPSPKGPVLEGAKQSDNPNTLKDGYLDRHIPTRHLTSDAEIRTWVTAHSASEIGDLPASEKIRMLNRLLDGWVSDEDVTAFEKICGSVDSSAEQAELRKAVGPREAELSNQAQRDRVHKALFIVLDPPALPPGTAQG